MADPNAEIEGTLRSHEREHDDAQLVARMVAGDERALGSLYDIYGAVVYGLAVAITRNPSTAESVVADAFGAIWRDAGTFDPERRSVFAWLSSMVRALALAERRASAVTVEPALPPLLESSPVGSALSRLSGPQRVAIELAYFRGLSRTEIARELGESEGAVGAYLRTAMDALRPALHPGTAAESGPRKVAAI